MDLLSENTKDTDINSDNDEDKGEESTEKSIYLNFPYNIFGILNGKITIFCIYINMSLF